MAALLCAMVCLAFARLFADGPANFAATSPSQTIDGFALPRAGREFRFPADHGGHPEFKIEWWYVTGHLSSTNGDNFGFQATFFRRAGPRDTSTNDVSATVAFGHDELHIAHMALLEVGSGRFIHEERLNRRGWDANSDTNGLNLKNGNWTLRWLDPPVGTTAKHSGSRGEGTLLLTGGVRSEASWRMVLSPAKPLVMFGTNGVSRKAAEPTAASHYLTFPRLRVEGELTRGSKSIHVTGQAWMDHEISSSQLGSDQAGWDWTCIQLDDGRELMAYRMRRKDGTTDPFSTLAWIGRDGSVRHFDTTAFRWETTSTWRSPRSKAEYPATVTLTAPAESGTGTMILQIEPLAPDQELSGGIGGIPYWEGACRVLDRDGKPIGKAFLEMTGYAGGWNGAL